MKKLKEILEFIMSLLGFLLNLKKKNPDEEDEAGRSDVLPGNTGDSGLVGGPFGGGTGMFGSPVDALGVRTFGQKRSRQLPVLLGWGLLAYAAVSCL